VVGENGAGKSTLMKVLSGVITDYEGTLRVAGRPLRFAGTRDAEAAGIAIIHQELNLVDDLSAAANIFLGRERHTAWGLLDERAMRRSAQDLFAELDCRIAPDGPVRSLRVGDQQLVEIAKALSQDASILIMDEPTSALSAAEAQRLFRVMDRLLARGVTILYISHKMDEVFRRADRITVLRDGRLVRTLARSQTSPREVTHLMVGREIGSFQPAADRRPGPVVLEVQSLSLPWTGHARGWRLRDVSLRLHRGEVLGVAGLLGAGRTELLECLFGTSPEPATGRIRLEGRDVRFDSPADARRAGVSLVTEDRKRLGLFPQLNVRQNVTISTLDELTSLGLIAADRERRAVRESIESLGIRTAGGETPIVELSGGNQQKAIIARWLRTRPKVLLLDDPTRGVDVGAKAELYQVIDRLCRDGLGIIVTSSELPELLALCDRIIVLREGRLAAEFPRSAFSEQAIMEAAALAGESPGGMPASTVD
jgi:ABC-type sugar transport system ATPase subunit